MKTDRIVKILKKYNDWRRGKRPYGKAGCPAPMTPEELGEAIEAAVAHLEKRIDARPFVSLVRLADEAYAKYRRESRNCGRKVPAGYSVAMAEAHRVVRYLMKRECRSAKGRAK